MVGQRITQLARCREMDITILQINFSADKFTGKFIGAEIDLQDGYIHFSTASQLRDTLSHHFAGRDGLVLLKIETSQLDIIWETARNGDLFPHLYDYLPLRSVVAEHHLSA